MRQGRYVSVKALVLAPFHEDALAQLAQHAEVVYEPWLETGRLTDPVELGERLAQGGFDVLIIEADFVFEETFEAAPGLRFVGACRGDIGEHIDLGAALDRGVTVVNTPGRNAVAVAELAIALMLGVARHVCTVNGVIRQGEWVSAVDNLTAWRGIELSGKTAGLIGYGAIGREVAKRLDAFEMDVIAYDPLLVDETGGKGNGADCAAKKREGGVSFVGLEELLSCSDFVSVHAALTPETQGLLGAYELRLMKPSAYLINTARAAIVDEGALLEALHAGQIAGAGLDVFTVEPLPPDSPWLTLDNVLLTPHMGGATGDVVRRHSEMILNDLRRWQRGERPLHLVTG
jgi:D-3-phosphoglycerate dehydrogenase / 2-oxoglutarate reductase